MKDVLIVANPSSGKKQAEEYAYTAKELYEKNNRQANVQLTEKKGDITHFAKVACDEQYDTLVVMGGDGTVSELINGLKDKENKPKIGVIPTGTVNNIAKGLGIAMNLDQAVSDLIESNEKTVDVGEVNDQLFVSSISAGAIPETIWGVSEEHKEKFGSLAYFMEGLKSLNEEEAYSVELTVDGETEEVDLSLLLVGVSNTIFGISFFFDEARYDDGKLHLFGLKQSTFGEKITAFSRLLTNEDLLNDEDRGFTLAFEEAEIRLKDGEAHVALDGDKGPSFPFKIKVLPKFVTFLIPEQENE